ncbi:unnamed protein product [Durusdinium trenchii]|uniref:Uncharacterized protein n=1 Tax=Durusdinium trenchii TaxID=1381693 RepID=A0ABP0IUX8_9DINO
MSGFQVGCRVRVLRGRQFSDFKERDEGVVLDINDECRNCTVVFDGRQEKVQVALKHLRVVGHKNADAGVPPEKTSKVLAKQIAEEMRLTEHPAVQALDVEMQELRKALQNAQTRLKSLEAKDARQADEILQLTRELSTAKQETLQSDLAVARSEAMSQEMLAQLTEKRQELAEEQIMAASLRKQLQDAPGNEVSLLRKELEQLREEKARAAAQEELNSDAWKAQVECLRAELQAEQAQRELQHELTTAGIGGKLLVKREISSDVQKVLLKAAFSGTLEAALQEHHVDLSAALRCRESDGSTLLHLAANSEAALRPLLEMLEAVSRQQHFEHALQMELLQHELMSSLNCPGPKRRTPLHLHCLSESATVKSLAQLLELQADPSLQDAAGATAFLECASRGRCEFMLLLLRASGGLGLTEEDHLGRTALHRSAVEGHTEAVRLLVQASAETDALDHQGQTACDLARERQQAAVLMLLEPQADPKEKGKLASPTSPGDASPSNQVHPEMASVVGASPASTGHWHASDHAAPSVLGPAVAAETAAQAGLGVPDSPQVRQSSKGSSSRGSPEPSAGRLPGAPRTFGPFPTTSERPVHATSGAGAGSSQRSTSAAGLYGVPTEGPTAADHLNVFGAAATTAPTAVPDGSPSRASFVPTEGPTAADHFNIYGGVGGREVPSPAAHAFLSEPPLHGAAVGAVPSPGPCRSASDSRLGQRQVSEAGLPRAGSDERLERAKSLGRRIAAKGDRKVSKMTVASRTLSGVEKLRERAGVANSRMPVAAEVSELEDSMKPAEGFEGDPLRKRLGKRHWSLQVSPGRRADECDDEPSWGSWF